MPGLCGEPLDSAALFQLRAKLARFFSENVTVLASSLERTVTDSADAVNGADAVLVG